MPVVKGMEQVLSLLAQAAVALYRKPRRPEWECFGSKPTCLRLRNFSKLAVEQGQYYMQFSKTP